MSPLVFTLLRLGFLLLLWIFVILLVATLRRDVQGTQVHDRRISRASRRAPHTSHARKSAPSQAHTPRVRDPFLAVTGGALTGTTLPLGTNPIVIGRSPDSALVLDDSFSSSRHARIYPSEGAWWIEDLDSTNGTFVNGHKISMPTPLHPGQQITIGKTTLELRE